MSPTENAQATTELHIAGMHCGSCAALIQECLIDVAGVSAASVDLESAIASVIYDPESVGIEDLRAAVVDAGYATT